MNDSDRGGDPAGLDTKGRKPSEALLLGGYLAACLLPLAAALLVQAAPYSVWETAAAGLGMVALLAMALQFFLSGRFRMVSDHLGIDRTMAFHKVAAWWISVAVVLHPPLYVLPTFLDDPALALERLAAYLGAPRFLSGVIGWLAVVALVLLGVLRQYLPARYEIWRAGHIILAVVAVGAALHHAVSVGRFGPDGPVFWLWAAAGLAVLGAVAVLYGWRWIRLHRRRWRLAAVTPVAERQWELDIRPEPGTPPLSYRAGQFVWLSVGGRRFPLLDNPFSIADTPTRQGLRLIVKEAGDFTGRIGALAPGTPISIDGPYGNFVLEGRPADSLLLIAGGVGIGPIMGLLRDLVARRDTRPIRLVYAASAPEKFVCLDEISAARDVLDLEVLLLSETAGEGWAGEVGILGLDRLRRVVEGLDPKTCLAMMCGPGGMVTAVSDLLLDIGLPMDNVVYERFDYAADANSRQDRRHRRTWFAVAVGLAAGVALFALL